MAAFHPIKLDRTAPFSPQIENRPVNTGFADGALDLQELKAIINPLVSRKVELEEMTAILDKR